MNPAIQYFEQLLAQGVEKLRNSGFSDDSILHGIEKASENKIGDIKDDMWQEVYKKA